tara:strand:- start:294 stop:671 length:378 start_codon:yes stop_codon:yes gene_type:complete
MDFFIVILMIAGYCLPLFIGLMVMGSQRRINLLHSSGLNKSGYVGYSWTYFFFGWFVPIFRGEIGIGILHFLFTVITFGLFQYLFMPFLYNKQFMTRLMTKGWTLNDTEEKNTLARMKLNISKNN